MSESFTLNLGFGGMCLFVPDIHEGKLVAMHVLFPNSDCCALHVPKLVFDESAPDGKKPTTKPATPVEIADRVLDLSGLTSVPQVEMLSSGIAALKKCSKVSRKYLSEQYSGNEIVGRVTFCAGTAKVDPCGRGGLWDHDADEPVELGIRFVWTMQVPGNELVLKFPKIGDPSDVLSRRLVPYENKLDLWIFHSPTTTIFDILPPKTSIGDAKVGDKAPHFKPFLALVTCVEDPTPTLRKFPDTSTNKHCYSDAHGLDLFCIGAQALAEPK